MSELPAWAPALPPDGNTDDTPADGGYHADTLHNRTTAVLAAIVALIGEAPAGTFDTIADRLGAMAVLRGLVPAHQAAPEAPWPVRPSTADVPEGSWVLLAYDNPADDPESPNLELDWVVDLTASWGDA